MKTIDVKIVRVYLTEGSGLLTNIIHYLKNEAKVRGVTVFRAIGGYGNSGEHNLSILDLSMDLPLVVEFFDVDDKVSIAVEYLSNLVTNEHLVIFSAQANTH